MENYRVDDKEKEKILTKFKEEYRKNFDFMKYR